MICSIGELNELDLGVHMQTMEEWNEVKFDWQPAQVILHGYFTRVIQEDFGVIAPESEAMTRAGSAKGLYIATYVTHGEGNLVALRVMTSVSEDKYRDPAPNSAQWVKKGVKQDMIVGTEYLYHEDPKA